MKRVRFRLGRVLLFVWLGPGLWFVMYDASAVDISQYIYRHKAFESAIGFAVLVWFLAHSTVVWAVIFLLPDRLRSRSGRDATKEPQDQAGDG